MQVSTNRPVVIISALLTMLILSGGTLALGFHNGWLRTGSGTATPEAIAADSQPTNPGNDGAALTEARPSAMDERSAGHDGDGDHHQRRSRGHDSDDH